MKQVFTLALASLSLTAVWAGYDWRSAQASPAASPSIERVATALAPQAATENVASPSRPTVRVVLPSPYAN